MEPVVTVNLAGAAYQLETSAHAALRTYLDRAEAALMENPDKAEIIADLEQAVADKASAYLSAYKTVINAKEMAKILVDMGPVQHEEAAEENTDDGAEESSAFPHKRLFRIPDDAMISGVCAGIGAYFSIDANLVRVLFVIAALLTHGVAVLVYVAMMFLVPAANTRAEWAAAHGLPSNAQEVIDQAKRNFAEYTEPGSAPWRWRNEARRAWRQARRARARAWARTAPPPPSGPFAFIARIFGALFLFVFSILSVALLIAFLVSMISLLTSGAMFGWAPPDNIPIWLAVVVLCLVYGALAGPISAMQNASHSALTGQPANPHHSGHGIGGLVIAALVIAALYYYAPGFQDWANHAWAQLSELARALPDAF